MDKKLKKLNLKRHSSVGKKMGSKIWAHVQYIDEIVPLELLAIVFNSYDFRSITFAPTLFRYDTKSNQLSFIECNDFDTKHEPTVGRVYTYSKTKLAGEVGPKIKLPELNPTIYHHKWMFVKDDYIGFNVEKSKKRSIKWKSILGVNKELSNKIGRKDFWNEWTKANGVFKK